MINAWSLLYDEIYGDDEMSPCKTDHKHDDDIVITTVGSGNTASADTTNVFSVDTVILIRLVLILLKPMTLSLLQVVRILCMILMILIMI